VAVATPALEAKGAQTQERDPSATRVQPLSRWVLAALFAGFLALTFTQSSGLIEDDSKFPLLVSPVSFIGSSLHVWSQNVYGGTADLGTGFLMPMGFFFAITHFLHIPTWCAERIWLALLLTVACWGVVRLGEALGIGNRWGRVVAGLAYCAAPIVFTWVTNSISLLSVMFLPWVIVPLVIGSREGSPRRAAARSGVAVALMGGANAVAIIAVLPLGLIWLATRQPGPRRRALFGWWVVALALACFWWLAATSFVGKYGYNYLPYTETSITTTSTTSVFESLRGASFWVGYFDVGGPLVPADWILVSTGYVIVATAVVTALGLAGLCRRIPERLFLITSLAFGVLVISAGYAGSFGGLFSHRVQHLLQGKLAPFRNVSKFSPDVALVLALGLASMLSLPLWGKVWHRRKRVIPGARAVTAGVAVVAVVAVVIAAAPYWKEAVYPSGGFAAIPHYWSEAGSWLDSHQGHDNALLVPGSSFATYTWGDPLDEPLEVVSDTSVEWRNIIPIASNGYTQMLDTVEQVLDSGTSSPGLAQFLSREGIKYVVERNDLDLAKSGAPPPAQVHQVLSETPGLSEVASFGPILPASQVEYGSLPVYDSATDGHLRPVEIFRVDAPTSIVSTYPTTNPVVVSGNVSSLLPLAAAGVVNGRAAVLAGDAKAKGVAAAPKATWAITDGNQRRNLSFGGIRNNQSYVLNAGQTLPGAEPGVPDNFTVVPGTAHQTVESPIGAKSVSASSYGSSLLYADPEDGPAAAFDGNASTAWVADAADNSVGQWVSITFDHPMDLSTITVTPLAGGKDAPSISRITITTDRGSVTRSLPPGGSPVRLSVPQGKSSYLKITITAVKALAKLPAGAIVLGAGITNIAIPGVSFQPQMKVPDDEATSFDSPTASSPAIVFNRPIANANLSLGFSETDDPSMARAFSIPKAMTAGVTGYAVPQPSAILEQLLEFLAPAPATSLKVTASSWLGDLPRFRAENLVSDSTRPWIANVGDKTPSLELSWGRTRTISSISLSLSVQASRPTKIAITSAGGTRLVLAVPKTGGVIDFPPLTTDSLKVQFLASTHVYTLAPDSGIESPLPVGLSQISIPALDATVGGALHTDAPITLSCGQGPPIEVDGTSIPTSLTGTLGDLIDLKPMRMVVCPLSSHGLQLAAGSHTFAAPASLRPFEVTSLSMQDAAAVTLSTPLARTATIKSWTAENRSIKVSAGPATYLAVAQNYNSGWTATLGSKTLKPVRLDGWQQGYVVPAGQAGVVKMVMTPDHVFRLLLVVGAALLLALLVLALLPARRKEEKEPSAPRAMPARWILFAGALVVLAVIAGPLALVAVPLVLIGWRWGRAPLTVAAFVAFLVAGIAAAWDPAVYGSIGAGAFSAPAQIASVVALAAVLSALVLEGGIRRRWRKRKERSSTRTEQ
jgi:arabinofuranan 3-O-arabinosyltransferase